MEKKTGLGCNTTNSLTTYVYAILTFNATFMPIKLF
jgi:hypothetical protein